MSKSVTLGSNEKMKLEMEVEGTSALIRPVGVIDEDVNFSVVLTVMSQLGVGIKQLSFDMSQVSRMNSCGVREWLLLLERLPSQLEYDFKNVNELLVEQANMIPGILGKKGTRIVSFQAPYFCSKCKKDVVMTLEPKQVIFDNGTPVAPPFNCPTCKMPLTFDWIEDEYFSFIKRL